MNNPLSDALGIIKKDWKLLAGLNALYFCVLVIGTTIALLSPGFHMYIIQYLGSDTIAGSAGITGTSGIVEATRSAGISFISSIEYVLIILLPSIVLPLWGPIFGMSKFFVWGVAYVAPLPGAMTLGSLLPQYVLMLLQGEAYIISIFACIRPMITAINYMDTGIKWMLREYARSVIENLNLIVVVFILLAIASLYQAFVIPALNGLF